MFANCEIDQILTLLKNYCKSDNVEYVYSLYDTSYSNRPLYPTELMFIIPDDTNIEGIKNVLLGYEIDKECCYGIGDVILIKKQ